MIRVLVEISLPAAALARIREILTPGALPEGVIGRLETPPRAAGCEAPAVGGAHAWTPCTVFVEADSEAVGAFEGLLHRLKHELVAAARPAGVEWFHIPAYAQVGDEYRRLQDLLDVLPELR